MLLIAKLDRLARDAHFLLGLEKAGVEFLAADMPYVNRVTIGVMALVAEEETRATSARTKAAFAAAKAQGVRLGNPQLRPGDSRTAANAHTAWSGQATRRAAEIPALRRGGAAGGCYDTAAVRGRAHRPRSADATRGGRLAAMAGAAHH